MAVDLLANVIVNGQHSGLDGIASALLNLANTAKGVSGAAQQFLKDSAEVYKEYETNMLGAEAALGTQYESATVLKGVMGDLNKQAAQWASSTIFHTSDVSEAINEAAHAGWTYQQMVEGIPAAMLIAQAGNMELSQGLDQLTKMANGTGLAFEDMGQFVDQWAMAANRSATNIAEMGDAYVRLGPMAQFANNTAEVFTMLGTLANVGLVGEQAGTMMRNSIMRLIAPTQKANEAMALLGASESEIAQLKSDEKIQATGKRLKELGFSAYDAQGKLKPLTQIFSDLNKATSKITDDQEKNALIASIFPTRTIASALAFMKAAGDDWNGLYDGIINSAGYAQKVSDTMMSGLMGSEELFASKVEEFKRRTGENIAPQLEALYEFGGGFLDAINGMDDVGFAALVGGIEAIAGFAPALSIAAGAMALIAHPLLAVPVGAMALAAGIGAAIGAVNKYNELEFKSHYGEMTVDMQAFDEVMKANGTTYENATNYLTEFDTKAQEAQTKYQEYATTLKELMTGDFLTSSEVGEKEKNKYLEYGENAYKEVIKGIEAEKAKDKGMLNHLFKAEELKEGTPEYESLQQNVKLYDEFFNDLTSKAEAVNESLQLKIKLSVDNDGLISEEELADIQNLLNEYNEIMASARKSQMAGEQAKALWKAQQLGPDATEDIIKAYGPNGEYAQSVVEGIGEDYGNMIAEDARISQWKLSQLTPGTPEYEAEVKRHADNVANWTAQYQTSVAQAREEVAQAGIKAFGQMMEGSDYQGLYTAISGWDASNGLADELAGYSYEDVQSFYSQLNDINGFMAHAGTWAGLLSAFGYGQTESGAALIGLLNSAASGDLGRAVEAVLMGMQPGTTAEQHQAEYTETTEQRQAEEQAKESAETAAQTASDLNYAFRELSNLEADQDAAYRENAEAAATRAAETAETVLDAVSGAAASLGGPGGKTIDEHLDQLLSEPSGPSIWQTVGNWIGSLFPGAGAEGATEGAAFFNEAATAAAEAAANIPTAYMQSLESRKAEMAAMMSESVNGAVSNTTVETPVNVPAEVEINAEGLQAAVGENTVTIEAEVVPVGGGEWGDPLNMTGLQLEQQVNQFTGEVAMTPETSAVDSYEAPEKEGEAVYSVDASAVEGFEAPEKEATAVYDVDASAVDGYSPPNKSATVTYTVQTIETKTTINEVVTKNVSAPGAGSGSGVNNVTNLLYGEGGRADTASIFGEAGAEWAIPERHDDRTAELLDAARQASGFSWGELIARNGGLNGSSAGVETHLTYSPTIYATDAAGVESVLAKDKKRVESLIREAVRRAMDDFALRKRVEVFA